MKRILLAVLLVVPACKAEKSLQRAVMDPAAVERSVVSSPATSALAPHAQPQAPARMIIRNATMSIVVRDAVDVLQKVTALAESKGGYVADTRRWKEREQVRASAVLRVPAAQLMPILAAIRGLAIRVEGENINAEDVSQEYTDLAAQLRNLQAT